MALQEKGYHVLVFMAAPTVGNVDRVMQEILDYQVDGIVLASVAMSSTLASECEAFGIPVVLFNRDQDDPRFDCTTEAFDFPYADSDAVPVEVPAGTALIFNGYLLHRSLENSGRHGYRRALANHYMSAESLLPWSPPGPHEHMGIADFRDIVLVAGEGAWETHPTKSLPSTRRMGELLAEKGIPHDLDIWGHDSAHDWPWWQKQITHHLPRFC